MNETDYHTLFASLNNAVDTLYRNRTPDPRFVAAFDTLKQARAMLEKSVVAPKQPPIPFPVKLAA